MYLSVSQCVAVSLCRQRAVRAVSALRPLAALRDARFGSALAAIPDVNGDGWADAAVGAPLEEGHRGALYVFHGAAGGLRERHAQVGGGGTATDTAPTRGT